MDQYSSRSLRLHVQGLWDMQDVQRAFGVTQMTIWNWRQKRGFPVFYIPGPNASAVRFIPDEIRKWAKDNGYRIREPLRQQISQQSA